MLPDNLIHDRATVSKSGSVVKIQCESDEHAEQVFDALTLHGTDQRLTQCECDRLRLAQRILKLEELLSYEE